MDYSSSAFVSRLSKTNVGPELLSSLRQRGNCLFSPPKLAGLLFLHNPISGQSLSPLIAWLFLASKSQAKYLLQHQIVNQMFPSIRTTYLQDAHLETIIFIDIAVQYVFIHSRTTLSRNCACSIDSIYLVSSWLAFVPLSLPYYSFWSM